MISPLEFSNVRFKRTGLKILKRLAWFRVFVKLESLE